MKDRKFKTDDEVLIVGDYTDFKGQWGRVVKFETVFERYFVYLPDVHRAGQFSAFSEDELEFLDPPESVEEYEVEEGDVLVDVPQFGMSPDEFATHLQLLIGRTLTKVGQVGPAEVFFGFQEFEGLTPQEVLIRVLGKIEESMIMHAQLHILVARIGTALDQVNPSEEST